MESVVVEPDQQNITYLNAAAGKPNMVAVSTSPAMVDLIVRKVNNGSNLFPFTDAGLANRVAEALDRAAKLCGGER